VPHTRIAAGKRTRVLGAALLCCAASGLATACGGPSQPARDNALAAGAASVTAGQFQRVFDPDPGVSPPCTPGDAAANSRYHYVNDHTFVYDTAKNQWQLFGIYHNEPADPGDETTFVHAYSSTGLAGPYHGDAKTPTVLGPTETGGYADSHLWAPDVIKANGVYRMFYSGGNAGPGGLANYEIDEATSTDPDLGVWTPLPSGPLFKDGYAARDPDVLRVGDHWVMYYEATTTPGGGNDVVAARTSTDLVHWSDRQIVYTDQATSDDANYSTTESPTVLARDGWYYLFIGPRPLGSYIGTDVFASKDPLHFDVNDQVGHIQAHAAEVVEDQHGAWWISSAGWEQCGVYLAPLTFHDAPHNGA
jgi:arabinan endo-1,5-alpha-L-arabinosidase